MHEKRPIVVNIAVIIAAKTDDQFAKNEFSSCGSCVVVGGGEVEHVHLKIFENVSKV